MGECFVGGFGKITAFPVGGEKMSSTSGSGSSPAKYTFTIDAGKRYFIHAAGTNTTVSNPSIAGALWFYDGAGQIQAVTSNWSSNNDFTCTASGDQITVKNALPSGYASHTIRLMVTLIPLE